MINWIIIRLFFLGLILGLTACSSLSKPYLSEEIEIKVNPKIAEYEIPEAELIDITIKIFDTAELAKDEDDSRGLSQEIRNAELRYMPVHLKYTLKKTGYWGNVKVVPLLHFQQF